MIGKGPVLLGEENAGVLKRLLQRLQLRQPEMIRVEYVYRDEVLISAMMLMKDYALHTIGQWVSFDGAFQSFAETSVSLMVISEELSFDPPVAIIRVDRPRR
jgi:hypothetical protein